MQCFGNLSGHKVSYPSLRQMLSQLPQRTPESADADMEDPEEELEDEEFAANDDPEIEEGNRVFAVNYCTTPAKVNVTSTISQRIAEGFARNQPAKKTSLEDLVPKYVLAFRDIFEKESLDSLPDHCEWDHAIELTGEPKSIHRKLYPLLPAEQVELDKFLEENISSGISAPPSCPWLPPSSSSRKRMGCSGRFRTIGTSTPSL